ncbi:MAG: hypothetical protein ACERKO_07060, partial [Acetanaerobacterium sp.]
PNPSCPHDFVSVRFSRAGVPDAYTVSDGSARAAVDGEGLMLSLFSGEDLQGEYWGGSFVLPQGLLQARFDVQRYTGGEHIWGNLLHASESDGSPEFATLFAIDGEKADIAAPQCFGAFEMIAF